MKGWPHVRAALVLFHVVGVMLMALPTPSGYMNPALWTDPNLTSQFDTWAALLTRVGIEMTSEEVKQHSRRTGMAIQTTRQLVLTPFEPYLTAVGARQSWRLFAAPGRVPARLRVDISNEMTGEDSWQQLYLTGDIPYAWRPELFTHHRFRKLMTRTTRRGDEPRFERLARWFALQTAKDFPNAKRVRFTLTRNRIPPPDQLADGVVGKRERTRVRILVLTGFRR